MGAVYEAVDQRLGITVALKETLSSETSMRRQFRREARLLAGMQHPALPRVSDHFVEGKRAFLVMQFIAGLDLAKIIAQQPGPFPREQVIAWADQLLDALVYLHSRDPQVIHRDIKPNNLKLTATGQIALLDFGLAKAQPSDPSITSSQAFFGYTRHYAPLEQIQDQRTDPRSDIYALGATLYHLLTGVKPPDAMVRASAVLNSGTDPLLPANKIREAVGRHIASILIKAMAQKPEDRYADANEFREALRRAGGTKDGAGVQPGTRVRVASKAQVPVLAPTVHIDNVASVAHVELPVLQMTLVASAKRFGPSGVTAVLGLILTLAGGILYGSQRWFPSPDEVVMATSAARTTAITLRPVRASRRSERPHAVDNVGFTAAKTGNRPYVNAAQRTRATSYVVDAVKYQAESKPVVRAKSQSVSGPEPRSTSTRRSVRRPGAPTIRFPNPEFQDNDPAPSPESRIRSYGFFTTPSSAAPKFYPAAAGTEIVR
jgi:hypothetical protein